MAQDQDIEAPGIAPVDSNDPNVVFGGKNEDFLEELEEEKLILSSKSSENVPSPRAEKSI